MTTCLYFAGIFHITSETLSTFTVCGRKKQILQVPSQITASTEKAQCPGGGVLPKKLGRGVRPASQNPYPIYDQNLRFSLPYL